LSRQKDIDREFDDNRRCTNGNSCENDFPDFIRKIVHENYPNDDLMISTTVPTA
jgi:hypothetical protein